MKQGSVESAYSKVFDILRGVNDKSDPKQDLEEAIVIFLTEGQYVPRTMNLDQTAANVMVRMRLNPNRFQAGVFDGDWAFPNRHPDEGEIRLIRVVTGNDKVTRVIGRQGSHLFAYPWLKEVAD